jgi:hypothetical protein
MKPVLSVLLALLAGCGPPAAAPRIRVVHVAWPGRPVSDAMDREVLGDPGLRAALAAVDFEATTVEAAPAEARAALDGLGTLAFVDGVLAGRRRGASTARALRDFVARVAAVVRGRAEADAAHWLAVGLPERALAVLDPAVDPAERLDLEVRARLALGDVATARAAIGSAGEGVCLRRTEARVLLAERRPRDAAAVLGGVAEPGDEERFLLGRALLDVGERPQAYALLEPIARGDGSRAGEAADLLAAAITGGHGHAHR